MRTGRNDETIHFDYKKTRNFNIKKEQNNAILAWTMTKKEKLKRRWARL